MDAAKSETTEGDTAPRRALLLAYLAVAVLGYVLGIKGTLPLPESSTPLARVGFALSAQNVSGISPAAWTALAQDIDQVRLEWPAADTTVLDLVIAVRGLASGGNPEWTRAEQLCKALKWSRCDRPALEELARRSRP